MTLLIRGTPDPQLTGGSTPMATVDLRPMEALRGMTVVSGGPVAAALASAVAPFAAARRWPDRLPSDRSRRLGWAATVAALAAPWVYSAAVRPWLRTWGSTVTERAARYPGDVDDPLFTTTRAVTVHAPADEVWAWLVQIGADRGGFYSYDWLENLAGCRLHSADRIHPEWQDREAGDPLVLIPGLATRFAQVDPPRALVIENWGAYVVEPLDGTSCRLIARSHAERSAVAAAAYVVFIELPHAVMERKMLLGIERRAEAAVAASP